MVNGGKVLDGLELNQDQILDDQIQSVTAQWLSTIRHLNSFLRFKSQARKPQLDTNRTPVDVFEQAWAELAMNVDATSNNPMDQCLEIFAEGSGNLKQV